MDELRKPKINKAHVEEELADLVIRLMDFSVHRGYDVAGAISKKMKKNEKRPYRHGGKRC